MRTGSCHRLSIPCMSPMARNKLVTALPATLSGYLRSVNLLALLSDSVSTERRLFPQPRRFKDTPGVSLQEEAGLSLAEAPDGGIILEHLSAVCLHHGSCAATGATGK
ncbi:unnamed protein product [Pleuronectes platessa]|uniref:Uncharacterized protein n=1 Tax=Pleuronectes platessa TaxID=8262 RepID=A0A9N7VM24_PLEPL|nr:unnamed protein product [Pleuronectes platessa]